MFHYIALYEGHWSSVISWLLIPMLPLSFSFSLSNTSYMLFWVFCAFNVTAQTFALSWPVNMLRLYVNPHNHDQNPKNSDFVATEGKYQVWVQPVSCRETFEWLSNCIHDPPLNKANVISLQQLASCSILQWTGSNGQLSVYKKHLAIFFFFFNNFF